MPSRTGATVDVDPLVEAGRALPVTTGPHEHDVELDRPELGPEAERLHEARARVVEVREPVRVEHHALAVDLRVPHPDPVGERIRTARSAAELGARAPARTASMHCLPERTHLVVGERAVEGTEPQREREADLARAERVGAEDVEEGDVLRAARPRRATSVACSAAAGTVSSTTNARSTDDAGKRDTGRASRSVRVPASRASTSISHATTGADERRARRPRRPRPRRRRRPVDRRRAPAPRASGGNRRRVAASSRRSAMRSSWASASSAAVAS